jgi:rod shape-determining protein MreD
MKLLGQVLLGFVMLTVQTSFATLVPMYGFAPNLVLPIAIYLGVSPDVQIVRGATTCFVLGYLVDAYCGSPMGLQTFVLVASFMVARGAGLRLFPQGPAFQIFLTFVIALAHGGTIVALRTIFEQLTQALDLATSGVMLLQSALVTALVSPAIFGMVARIEGTSLQKPEERTT